MSAPVDRIPRSEGGAAFDRPVVVANVSRRRFLQGASALGGLVLAVGFSSAARAQEPKKYGADGMPNGWVDDPLAFVSIAEDGTVTSSADMPSRFATRSRVDWGDWKQPQTSHLPFAMRTVAAGGSIVACARCGT